MKTVMRTVVRIFWGKHLSLARPSVAVRRPSRPRPAQRLRHATTNQQRCGYPPRRPARPRELVRCNRSCPRRTDLSSVERDGEGAICIVAEMGSMPQLSSSRTSLSLRSCWAQDARKSSPACMGNMAEMHVRRHVEECESPTGCPDLPSLRMALTKKARWLQTRKQMVRLASDLLKRGESCIRFSSAVTACDGSAITSLTFISRECHFARSHLR